MNRNVESNVVITTLIEKVIKVPKESTEMSRFKQFLQEKAKFDASGVKCTPIRITAKLVPKNVFLIERSLKERYGYTEVIYYLWSYQEE